MKWLYLENENGVMEDGEAPLPFAPPLPLPPISFIKRMSSSFIDCEEDGVALFPVPPLLIPWICLFFSNEWKSSSYFCCGRVTKSFTFGIVRVEMKKE